LFNYARAFANGKEIWKSNPLFGQGNMEGKNRHQFVDVGRKGMRHQSSTWLTAGFHFEGFPCPFVGGGSLFALIPARHDGSAFEITIWGKGREFVRIGCATCTETCTTKVSGDCHPALGRGSKGREQAPSPEKSLDKYALTYDYQKSFLSGGGFMSPPLVR